jgi:hypothetical protein
MPKKDKSESTEVAIRPAYDVQLQEFEQGLLGFLDQHGLPSQSILVSVPERLAVFGNIKPVINRLPDDKKKSSIYVSKFVAACASGLFDGAPCLSDSPPQLIYCLVP